MAEPDSEEKTPYTIAQDIWMVPCRVDPTTNKFAPVHQPSELQPPNIRSRSRVWWTPEEDLVLKEIAELKGIRGWSSIARDLNIRFHSGLPTRKGKQCRERYFNHLDPALKKTEWASEEDSYLLKSQAEKGNRWSEISKNMAGRTENQVKNRFKALTKRSLKTLPCGVEPRSVGRVGGRSDIARDVTQRRTAQSRNGDLVDIGCIMPS